MPYYKTISYVTPCRFSPSTWIYVIECINCKNTHHFCYGGKRYFRSIIILRGKFLDKRSYLPAYVSLTNLCKDPHPTWVIYNRQ